MDPFEQKVLETIRGNGLTSPGEGIIAGVSGGADSVCLLRVLLSLREQLQIRLYAVHVEHGLRGEAALEDAAFVEELCGAYGIPCIVEHIPVREIAGREHLSLEEAGRRARYECFERLRSELGAEKTAVAHHAEDQAETILLNLCRGSGVKGLCGMQMRAGCIIRPLLETGREEIEAYLRRIGQSWRLDRTNEEDSFARNRIRLRVIPQLKQINSGSVEHFCETAALMQRAESYLQRQAEMIEKKCVDYSGQTASVDRNALLAEDGIMQECVLRNIVCKLRGGLLLKDFGSVHVRSMKEMLCKPSGKQADLPGGLTAAAKGPLLIVTAQKTAGETEQILSLEDPVYGREGQSIILEENALRNGVSVKVGGMYGWDSGKAWICARLEDPPADIPEKKYTKWISYDRIKGSLCLRSRRPGDYLVVNASGGRKKLKDYLIDEKIPAAERGRVLVLAQDDHVLWVAGWRISEDAKIRPGTGVRNQVIRISVSETGQQDPSF